MSYEALIRHHLFHSQIFMNKKYFFRDNWKTYSLQESSTVNPLFFSKFFSEISLPCVNGPSREKWRLLFTLIMVECRSRLIKTPRSLRRGGSRHVFSERRRGPRGATPTCRGGSLFVDARVRRRGRGRGERGSVFEEAGASRKAGNRFHV